MTEDVHMVSRYSKTPNYYQIKISLVDSPLPIWRRLIIDPTLPLSLVHEILQISMGWWSTHLYEFKSKSARYGSTRDGSDVQGINDADQTILNQVLKKAGETLTYHYDFGDDWLHTIVLEKVIKAEGKERFSAFCSHGKRACPPEDCGGVSGFAELLEAIEDPCHSGHQESKAWVGDSYDPNAFDQRTVNLRLELLDEEIDAELDEVVEMARASQALLETEESSKTKKPGKKTDNVTAIKDKKVKK